MCRLPPAPSASALPQVLAVLDYQRSGYVDLARLLMLLVALW